MTVSLFKNCGRLQQFLYLQNRFSETFFYKKHFKKTYVNRIVSSISNSCNIRKSPSFDYPCRGFERSYKAPIKVNELQSRRCVVTPRFPKTKKKDGRNFGEAGNEMTNDNDSNSQILTAMVKTCKRNSEEQIK